MKLSRIVPLFALLGIAAWSGCSGPKSNQQKADELTAERAKLDPAERALVEAQEWCVIDTEDRLGSMGPPIKLIIKEQPIFVCCKSCKRKAEASPVETLAKVADLKAKAKAEKK